MENTHRFRSITGIFLAAEIVCYLCFLILDLRGGAAVCVWLKYAGILGCFAMAVFSAVHGGDRFVAAALGLTVIADTFLLVLDAHYMAGVAVFLCVQLIYFVRLERTEREVNLLWVRVFVLAVLLTVLWAWKLLDPLNILVVFYISTLVSNAIQSFWCKEPWGKMFCIGLALFVCCDMCVGLYNNPGNISDELYRFVRVGMWMFYLPSQVLIVWSGFPKKGTN